MPITSLLTQALESGKPELWQKILESAAPQEISHALVEIFKKETGYTQRIEHVITTFAKLEVTTRGTSTHTQVVRFLRLAEEARTSQTSVSELILELAKFSFIEQPGVL